MGDPQHGVGDYLAEAKSLEWALSFVAGSSPWSVEQAMTQLLAHESAEGFGPPLTEVVRSDARLIHALGKRDTPTAVVALRGFAAMSPIDTQRELARAHADRLVAQGLPDPPWAATIGRVRIDGCWWSHDPFDETAVVLCSFSYDGADGHDILAVIDRVVGGGRIKELLLSREQGHWVRAMHERTGPDDDMVTEPIDPAYARRLIEDAVAATDWLIQDEHAPTTMVPQAYRKMRGLTLARARALAAAPAPAQPFPGSVEIELLKQRFLASAEAAALPATPVTRQAVDLLVAQFTDQAACHPLHLGPRRVQAVLGLPELSPAGIDDPDLGRVVPDVAQAWVAFSAAQRGLPGDATERLDDATRHACDRLRSGDTKDAGGAAAAGGPGPS